MEKDIEKRCCELAEKRGWYYRKFVSPGRRGAFDRIFIRKGVVLFVEFKQPGKTLDPLQDVEFWQLKTHDARTYVCDNLKSFVSILDANSNP